MSIINNFPSKKLEQSKIVSPSLDIQEVLPDEGYNLNKVTVEAIPVTTRATPTITIQDDGQILSTVHYTEGYILEGVANATKKLSTCPAKTIIPSTSEQTAVAAGKYTTGAVKVAAMTTATQATPSITVGSDGLITASATQTAGYVAAGTKSATKQLTAQAAKTVTPSTSAQTAVAAGRYTTGAVTVAAIPTTYKNMATGTATAAYTYTAGASKPIKYAITVTGLGFKPSHVITVRTQRVSGSDVSDGFMCSYDTNAYGVHVPSSPPTLSLTTGGFDLSYSWTGSASAITGGVPYGTYMWIAWA